MNQENSDELKRYETIINYFENNKDRLFNKENQTYLTRVYANLINKASSEEFKNLASKLHNLVRGPNSLLGHWEELEKLRGAS